MFSPSKRISPLNLVLCLKESFNNSKLAELLLTIVNISPVSTLKSSSNIVSLFIFFVYSLYSTVASTFKLAVPAVDNVLAKVNFLPVPADFAWLNYALVGFVLGVVLTFFVKENK